MLKTIKNAVKAVPIVGPTLIRLRSMLFPQETHSFLNQQLKSVEHSHDFKSNEYWEFRYKVGGNSGAGSYNRLAHFKASYLNEFVQAHHISSIIEFGCGDGNQLSLAHYPRYIGVDVSDTALALCRNKFAGDPTKRFLGPVAASGLRADLALSLDVIYHLVEDDVFDSYMRVLFSAAERYVIIYASNKDEPRTQHVRHRLFTKWIASYEPRWTLKMVVPNAYPFDPADPDNTSFAEFYVYACPCGIKKAKGIGPI